MFGYVRPSFDRFSEDEKNLFQYTYCGLCHALKAEYGLAGQMILNYDLTLLAMLLSTKEEKTCSCGGCVIHPFSKKCFCTEDPALATAADYSIVLTWWQVQDGIKDHSFLAGLKYRMASLFLHGAFNKAKNRCPGFNQQTRTYLEKLDGLEKEQCPEIDVAADAFAMLLAGISEDENDENRARILRMIFYHLGRWIYLVDAVDDLSDDMKSGNYNPLTKRFTIVGNALNEAQKTEIANTLDQSIRMMASAFELGEFGIYRPILENIFYEGLYLVGNSVICGTFRKRGKTGIKRKDKT